jgi:hypothetical protein
MHVGTFGVEWDKALPFCLLILRTEINQSTGVFLACLFLCRNIRTLRSVVIDVDLIKLLLEQNFYAMS